MVVIWWCWRCYSGGGSVGGAIVVMVVLEVL